MNRPLLALFAAALSLTAWCPLAAHAQTAANTTLTVGAPLAAFEDARALGIDPAGRVYVADAGAAVVVRLTPAGADPTGERLVAERLGGPGSEEGQFYEPADVDPTNGLVLLVADAGNSRVQRFSKEFAHLETLPVGKGYGAAGAQPARPVYDAGEEGAGDLGRGRPVAVASAQAGVTYAIDAAEGSVIRWDGGRRAERVVGGFGRSDGRLADPVALAVAPGGLLYVADRGRGAVLAYDLFGTYVRTVAQDLESDVQALVLREGRLWVVLSRRLLRFDAATGRPEGAWAVRGMEEALVDVALSDHPRGLYLLTPTSLYRAAR